MRVVYQREGVKAFGKGVYANIMIFVPSTAMTWGSYEMVKRGLGLSTHFKNEKE